MNSRKLFSWFLSVFLFCGLSGLAWAVAQTSDRTPDQALESSLGCAPDRDVDRGALLATDLTAQGILVAGLFEKKSHCFEVYIKELKGKRLKGKTWASDCKAAKDNVGLDVVLKMGATCTKTKDSQDSCY
jgi:hypothetical protein